MLDLQIPTWAYWIVHPVALVVECWGALRELGRDWLTLLLSASVLASAAGLLASGTTLREGALGALLGAGTLALCSRARAVLTR